MNHHLQLFRFFHESEEPLHIENNLTRALALCLKHDRTLLFSFLRQWLREEDFNYILSNPPDKAEIEIDLQIETSELVDNARKLYAIGITEHDEYKDWSDLLMGVAKVRKLNFTDLVITVKDLTIIVEVKRTVEDCKHQLCQQALPFMEAKNPPSLVSFHYSWQRVIEQVKRQHHFNQLTRSENPFTLSLLQLIQTRFNRWVPTTPFAFLAFDSKHKDHVHYLELNKRLQKAMGSLGKDALGFFADRIAIRMPQDWATEGIPSFELYNEEPYLVMNVWPGNVKQQGWSLYGCSLDWIRLKHLAVGEEVFPLEIFRHIKFMHFNKYVTSLDIPICEQEEIKKEINTRHNFQKYSGKWNREQWGELDRFLSDHLSFDWKKECGWESHFENSERSYLTMSLGFWIKLKIPYSLIQQIDKRQEDAEEVGRFLKECLNSIVAAVEGRSFNVESASR